MNLRALLGQKAEQRAARLLGRHGLQEIARNWRCKGGELDLVMLHGDVLVFVEVRSREGRMGGSAAQSVGATKQARWWHAAQQFLVAHPQHRDRACRFDLVTEDAGDAPVWQQAVLEGAH